MGIYLNDVPIDEAQKNFYRALDEKGLARVLDAETLPLDEKACGRVLAAPVWAKISSPHYHASAMDGFAVKARATAGALPTDPVVLKCSEPSPQAVYLDTGDPLPTWADSVIPIENIEPLNQAGELTSEVRSPFQIRIRAAVVPWSHVRPLGEDIVATQLVLPAGHTIRPIDLGAIAASGHAQIKVVRKPRVAILPTGSELVPVGTEAETGKIIEFNSIVLAAQIETWGGQATRFPISPDILDRILSQVRHAARDHDLILINAGSSAGAEDYTAEVVKKSGTLIVHGIAVRPGHPVILGMINLGERSVPVIGVPGYPVSTALTGEIFIQPLLDLWLGRKTPEKETIQAFLTRKITSPSGDDDFVRVAVGRVGNRYLAAPLSRGAGVITSLVHADGITCIKRGVQGMQAGSEITVQLYRRRSEIDHTILVIGSHDISLDVMAQFLALKDRNLSSANVGSQGGLVALRRQECHLAGSHLFDPNTGEYNLSYVKKYLPETAVKVIGFVYRQQGLMVRRGNPKNIKGIDDLGRGDVKFCNRQRGAGTRVLLDYRISQAGIRPDQIQGYDHEEFTHLGVAAAIASGRADCGLGIAAAATALKLDFIPLERERYDLLIPDEYYESSLLQPLLDLFASSKFQATIMELPGYDTTPMGKLIYHHTPKRI